MSIKLFRRKYVKFATLPTENGMAICAFLIIEEGGEIVFVSEPKVIRFAKNNLHALSGVVSSKMSEVFFLSGNTRSSIYTESIPSPYLEPKDLIFQNILVWQTTRPPTKA